MQTIKKKKPNQRLICIFDELDGGEVFSGKKSFTWMQIKPKILQGRKPEMTYITGVKITINPFKYININVSFLLMLIYLK